jgi:hypothetical protein
MVHTEISPTEEADRLTIREVLDDYAHCGRAHAACSGTRPTISAWR